MIATLATTSQHKGNKWNYKLVFIINHHSISKDCFCFIWFILTTKLIITEIYSCLTFHVKQSGLFNRTRYLGRSRSARHYDLVHTPGSGAIKARRCHFWSQSHFSFIYSFTKSEIEMKSETVSLLWPWSLVYGVYCAPQFHISVIWRYSHFCREVGIPIKVIEVIS